MLLERRCVRRALGGFVGGFLGGFVVAPTAPLVALGEEGHAANDERRLRAAVALGVRIAEGEHLEMKPRRAHGERRVRVRVAGERSVLILPERVRLEQHSGHQAVKQTARHVHLRTRSSSAHERTVVMRSPGARRWSKPRRACCPRAVVRFRVISSDDDRGSAFRGSPAMSLGRVPSRKRVHGMSYRQKAASDEKTSVR